MRETVKVDVQVEENDEGEPIETHMAVMVENLNGEKVWLPKSEIEIYGEIIEMPLWLAEKKELV